MTEKTRKLGGFRRPEFHIGVHSGRLRDLQRERLFIKDFEFEADGRRYACSTVERKGAGAWWWFTVSGDPQSYAPFQADPSDTPETVQDRVLQYYLNRLHQLAQPVQRGSHWARRNVPAKPAAESAAESAPEASEAPEAAV